MASITEMSFVWHALTTATLLDAQARGDRDPRSVGHRSTGHAPIMGRVVIELKDRDLGQIKLAIEREATTHGTATR